MQSRIHILRSNNKTIYLFDISTGDELLFVKAIDQIIATDWKRCLQVSILL